MAQQVEHILGKDEVTGSNPVISSSKKHLRMGVPVRDYKKTKKILMGTPASESVKRVQKNLSSFLLFSGKEW